MTTAIPKRYRVVFQFRLVSGAVGTWEREVLWQQDLVDAFEALTELQRNVMARVMTGLEPVSLPRLEEVYAGGAKAGSV